MERNNDMDSNCIDRETLKSYFKKGMIPTEEQFAALIDSLHNIREDGEVRVTESNGLILYPFDKGKQVATVYSENLASHDALPLWFIAIGEEGALEIRNAEGELVLMLGQNGSLTVSGNQKAACYMSDEGEELSFDVGNLCKVVADGCWHDLPVEHADNARSREGFRMYHISACWYHPRSGKYAVCEAFASHSNGRRRKIQSSRKHWWGWSGKIKLRWQLHDGHLYLQMRSRKTRQGAEFISCRVETMWNC